MCPEPSRRHLRTARQRTRIPAQTGQPVQKLESFSGVTRHPSPARAQPQRAWIDLPDLTHDLVVAQHKDITCNTDGRLCPETAHWPRPWTPSDWRTLRMAPTVRLSGPCAAMNLVQTPRMASVEFSLLHKCHPAVHRSNGTAPDRHSPAWRLGHRLTQWPEMRFCRIGRDRLVLPKGQHQGRKKARKRIEHGQGPKTGLAYKVNDARRSMELTRDVRNLFHAC